MPKEIKETISKSAINKAKKTTAEKTSVNKDIVSKTKSSNSKKEDKVLNVKLNKSTTKKVNTKIKEKKSSSKKDTVAKTSKKTPAKTKAKTKKQIFTINEYYDLPYSYNKTVVKLLAQTPNKLFVYWEVSSDDSAKYIEEFGNDFFNNSYPVLIVKNTTMNYSFEVRIDDFANSWYLNINDANCVYEIDLGRRPIYKNDNINFDYVHIVSSNTIEAPNDDVLIKDVPKSISFSNTKTGITLSYDLSQDVYENSQKIASIYKFYLNNSNLETNSKSNKNTVFDFSNPSSKWDI